MEIGLYGSEIRDPMLTLGGTFADSVRQLHTGIECGLQLAPAGW